MRHAGRYVIRIHDKTDHGGEVIQASSGTVAMGLRAALDGDMTVSPRCKGNFAIKTDGAGAKHQGRHYAYHGDTTACGARLISSLSSAGASTSDSVSYASPDQVDTSSNEPDKGLKFDDRFHLIDELTKLPMIHAEYAIRRGDGRMEFGVTDADGATHLLTPHASAEQIEIYV